MYSKQQASAQKRKFWTLFGQYMKPVKSASGENINWLNYKTGAKNIFFRMEANTAKAWVSIELTHKGEESRHLYFQKFQDTRKIFEEIAGKDWLWQSDHLDEHAIQISRVFKELNGVNIMNENNWPAIISFLKPSIIALDEYWTLVKDAIIEE